MPSCSSNTIRNYGLRLSALTSPGPKEDRRRRFTNGEPGFTICIPKHTKPKTAQLQRLLDARVTADLAGPDHTSKVRRGQPTTTPTIRKRHTKYNRNRPEQTVTRPANPPPNPQNRPRDNLCWYCHNKGHMQNQCPKAQAQKVHFTRFFKLDSMGRPTLKKCPPPPPTATPQDAEKSDFPRMSPLISKQPAPTTLQRPSSPPAVVLDHNNTTESAARAVPAGRALPDAISIHTPPSMDNMASTSTTTDDEDFHLLDLPAQTGVPEQDPMDMDMDTYYQFLYNQEQYSKAEDNRRSQRNQIKEANRRRAIKEVAEEKAAEENERRRLADML